MHDARRICGAGGEEGEDQTVFLFYVILIILFYGKIVCVYGGNIILAMG